MEGGLVRPAQLWSQWKRMAMPNKVSGVDSVTAQRGGSEPRPWLLHWRKITRDLLLAFSAHIFIKFVSYVVLAIMSRYLEKGEMGEFFVAAALGTFFVQITELGTNTYLMRAVAERPEQALQRCSEVVSLRLYLCGVYLILFNGFVALVKPDLLGTALLTSLYLFL